MANFCKKIIKLPALFAIGTASLIADFIELSITCLSNSINHSIIAIGNKFANLPYGFEIISGTYSVDFLGAAVLRFGQYHYLLVSFYKHKQNKYIIHCHRRIGTHDDNPYNFLNEASRYKLISHLYFAVNYNKPPKIYGDGPTSGREISCIISDKSESHFREMMERSFPSAIFRWSSQCLQN